MFTRYIFFQKEQNSLWCEPFHLSDTRRLTNFWNNCDNRNIEIRHDVLNSRSIIYDIYPIDSMVPHCCSKYSNSNIFLNMTREIKSKQIFVLLNTAMSNLLWIFYVSLHIIRVLYIFTSLTYKCMKICHLIITR